MVFRDLALCQRLRCASAMRARPSAVFGPVESPPWNLHRFCPGSAFARQAMPFRVFAPHVKRKAATFRARRRGKKAQVNARRSARSPTDRTPSRARVMRPEIRHPSALAMRETACPQTSIVGCRSQYWTARWYKSARRASSRWLQPIASRRSRSCEPEYTMDALTSPWQNVYVSGFL